MSDDFPGDEGMSPMSEKTFPDGFGMSVEDVRALLAKKHDVSVPQDDPILMQVTILQVFLEAQPHRDSVRPHDGGHTQGRGRFCRQFGHAPVSHVFVHGHHSPFRLAQCRRLYPGDGASWMSVCWKALNTTAGH